MGVCTQKWLCRFVTALFLLSPCMKNALYSDVYNSESHRKVLEELDPEAVSQKTVEGYTLALASYLTALEHSDFEERFFINAKQARDFQQFLDSQSEVHTIAEVGSNAGHSSLVFLVSKPEVMVYSFDTATHAYTRDCQAFLDRMFPGRHRFIESDSLLSIQQFAQDSAVRFDFIFIDGRQNVEEVYDATLAMRDLAREGSFVLIDGLAADSVRLAFDRCVREGLLIPTHRFKDPNCEWALCRYNIEAL